MIPCVKSFPRVLRVGSPRPSNKLTVPARTCVCRYSSPSTRLRVFPFDQPSLFCSSVWLRFSPSRLIACVLLWPRGLATLSLRTGRLVFVRLCCCVSLLPALSRPSSCGPVALLPCPSVPVVSFLFVGVAAFRSCPPYRVRRPVAPWPY